MIIDYNDFEYLYNNISPKSTKTEYQILFSNDCRIPLSDLLLEDLTENIYAIG